MRVSDDRRPHSERSRCRTFVFSASHALIRLYSILCRRRGRLVGLARLLACTDNSDDSDYEEEGGDDVSLTVVFPRSSTPCHEDVTLVEVVVPYASSYTAVPMRD